MRKEEKTTKEPQSEKPDALPRPDAQPIITQSTATEIETEFEDKERESQEKVEAALFIAGKFLSIQELITLTDINPIMLKEILSQLQKKYSTGAIQIVKKNNLYKMDVADKYKDMVNKLASGESEFTKAEQETLAVIAYKQPVKQSVVVKIRGNKAYEHIKKFRDIGLIKAKRVSHTLELTLSEEFYDYFNVQGSKPIDDKKEIHNKNSEENLGMDNSKES